MIDILFPEISDLVNRSASLDMNRRACHLSLSVALESAGCQFFITCVTCCMLMVDAAYVCVLSLQEIDKQGMTPLHLAVKADMQDVVALLLSDLRLEICPPGSKVKPFHLACEGGNANIIELFCEEAEYRDHENGLKIVRLMSHLRISASIQDSAHR